MQDSVHIKITLHGQAARVVLTEAELNGQKPAEVAKEFLHQYIREQGTREISDLSEGLANVS